MNTTDSLLDRYVDFLRSRSLLFFLAGIATGGVLFFQPPPDGQLHLTLVNNDSIRIDSIRMEFGFDLNQSELLTLQLNPGERRTLALNHPPGKGFNVEVSYSDGQIQSFCANRNQPGHKQQLILAR